jgi:hypothetical protein
MEIAAQVCAKLWMSVGNAEKVSQKRPQGCADFDLRYSRSPD